MGIINLPSPNDQTGAYYPGRNGYNYSSCFSAATSILTPDGSKRISDLKKDEILYSWDKASGQLLAHTVKELRVSEGPMALTKVSHQHGAIEATGTHTVLVQQGKKKVWREVSELQKGDVLMVWQDGRLTPSVVTGTDDLGPQQVYNLDIEGGDNFIADGVVAHSYAMMPKGRRFSGVRRLLRHLSS
ncbi:MAG: hypothetical protein JO126_07630 [Alphaproteobacteria bacterium]|nr:hypothetical protein [Alphaproteobacteria bacterium]MBV8549309.1 hypothetical protein [Alphaproteobacteria bacterium]